MSRWAQDIAQGLSAASRQISPSRSTISNYNCLIKFHSKSSVLAGEPVSTRSIEAIAARWAVAAITDPGGRECGTLPPAPTRCSPMTGTPRDLQTRGGPRLIRRKNSVARSPMFPKAMWSWSRSTGTGPARPRGWTRLGRAGGADARSARRGRRPRASRRAGRACRSAWRPLGGRSRRPGAGSRCTGRRGRDGGRRRGPPGAVSFTLARSANIEPHGAASPDEWRQRCTSGFGRLLEYAPP